MTEARRRVLATRSCSVVVDSINISVSETLLTRIPALTKNIQANTKTTTIRILEILLIFLFTLSTGVYEPRL